MVAVTVIAPWLFHIGERWTLLWRWDGVGRLRDSEGIQYGMYVRLNHYPSIDNRNGRIDCCQLGGNAQVCTDRGTKYQFTLSGGISGAWLHTDGSKVNLSLIESGHPKLPRQFQFSGAWRGPNLVLDDQKSVLMYFLPGGSLTPAPSYTAPLPEKHATVTIGWGSLGDFDSLCAVLARGSAP